MLITQNGARLSISITECFNTVTTFLAAVWRFRNDFQQPLLPFVDKKSLDELQTLWLGWLRHEIAGWIDYPHRVRLVQLILTNQNELPGYIAEAQLSLDIINWFTEVPWKQTLREASEASLSEHRKKIESLWT